MTNTFLSVPFEDGKKCYVGQVVMIRVSVPSGMSQDTLFELDGHIIRCEQAGAQIIVKIEQA